MYADLDALTPWRLDSMHTHQLPEFDVYYQQVLFCPSFYVIESFPTLGRGSHSTGGSVIHNIGSLLPSHFDFISPWRLIHSTVNWAITSMNLRSDSFLLCKVCQYLSAPSSVILRNWQCAAWKGMRGTDLTGHDWPQLKSAWHIF